MGGRERDERREREGWGRERGGGEERGREKGEWGINSYNYKMRAL